MRRRSFLRGALILVAGSLISRALGMLFRFVLPILWGGGTRAAVGMGLFGMAYPIYAVVLSLSAAGVPLAISKLVAEHVARDDNAGALGVFRISVVALAILGLVSTVLLLVLAAPVARVFARDPRATLSILAIAPAIFFVSLETAYRGFFQGLQHMTPHATSQVVEQTVRVVTILGLGVALLPLGIEYAAAGASFGAVTGAVAGLGYLAWAFRHDPTAARLHAAPPVRRPVRPLLAQIVALAVPISLAGIVLPLMNLMDAAIVPGRLHAAGLGAQATALYGVLTGFAMPFIVLPTILTSALAVSLLPSISAAMAVQNRVALRTHAATALRVTLVLLLPAAGGLMLLAHPIPLLMFRSAAAGAPLAVLAPAILFIGMQQVTSGMLQGLGRPGIPLRNLIVGGLVKLVFTWTLTANPRYNIVGSALGTTLGFLVAAVLNLGAVRTHVGPVLDLDRMVLRPLIAVAAMGLAVRGTLVAVPLGPGLRVLGAVLAGAIVYGLCMVGIGGIRRHDLETVPHVGVPLARFLARVGLARG